MITRRGTPLVKKGDQVEKGDLLVSGLLPIYNDSQEIIGYEKTKPQLMCGLNTRRILKLQYPEVRL